MKRRSSSPGETPDQKGGIPALSGSSVPGAIRGRRLQLVQPASDPGQPEPPLAAKSFDEEDEETPRSVRAAAISALSDAQLVGLARSKDTKAFEALYRRHVAFAIHLATRIEGSTRDVEDVVHDAFIKAFTRIGDLAEPAAFRSWLGSIVVFAVRTRLRRTRLMNMLGLGRGIDPVDLDSLASPAASPHTRAQLAQIYALLRTLPTDERIAWTLRSVEGHELEVVARLTGCSLATVKRRISRAQRFLDDHFVTGDRRAEGLDDLSPASDAPPAPESQAKPASRVGAPARLKHQR
jgi:RNA polymerase sigma-70 factor (ECF subfamily)